MDDDSPLVVPPAPALSPGVHGVAVVRVAPGSVLIIHLIAHMVRLIDGADVTPSLEGTTASVPSCGLVSLIPDHGDVAEVVTKLL